MGFGNYDAHDESAIEHPKHYNSHPSGIECIEIAQHMNFNLGNVLKYIWRCDHKGPSIEDLQKAQQYLGFEIERRMKMTETKND